MAFVYVDQNEPLEEEEEFQVRRQRLELERVDPLSLFRYEDARVKRIFRMSIVQLHVLATILSPRLQKQPRNRAIPVLSRVMISLLYFYGHDFQSHVGLIMGCHQSTVSQIVAEFIEAMLEPQILDSLIRMPTQEEVIISKKKFERSVQEYSQLSVPDCVITDLSSLRVFFSQYPYGRSSVVVADNGYTPQPWCLVPFKRSRRTPRTPAQLRFNRKLKRGRSIIENVNAMLKESSVFFKEIADSINESFPELKTSRYPNGKSVEQLKKMQRDIRSGLRSALDSFKIAVRASRYDEDLPRLTRLTPAQKRYNEMFPEQDNVAGIKGAKESSVNSGQESFQRQQQML
uniref:DDE Tnp4 domain-containing protein n=1 Tax=Ditylenchus dipsaci TaxID=166011 RepID=A0A915D629_9BILA